MKRLLLVLLGVAALAVALLVVVQDSDDAPSGPSSLATASLDLLDIPEPPPESAFVRTVYAETSLGQIDAFLDLCRGPIAAPTGDDTPILVAEHDYCGGSGWIPRVAVGDRVGLRGEGIEPGTYEVTVIGHALRGKALVSDLPDAPVVLQTCISKTEMVLVGIEKISDEIDA